MSMKYDTKLAVVIRQDLEVWQKLNVTAFLASGIAATTKDVFSEPYEDGSGHQYLPMFRQPVLVFSSDGEQIRKAYDRAMLRNVPLAIYTEESFAIGHISENQAMLKEVPSENLNLVGIAMRGDNKTVGKILKGMRLHK
jgi:hypothetical protein